MAKIKKTLNVRVNDTVQMIELMEKLGTIDMELEAESRPRLVRIVAHGTKEEIRNLELKIKEITESK